MPATDDLTVDSILGDGGRVARRLEGFQAREPQLRMARRVAEALSKKRHLIAEAGTGTGKSFAYLTPAILHATDPANALPVDPEEPEGEKRSPRILISTHTITLQEQLIAKDIPLINAVTPREFSAVLVKGRGNYISIRRLNRARARATTLFEIDSAPDQLRSITRWAKDTTDGSRSTMPIRPSPAVWDEIRSDSGNCLYRKCPHHDACHYYAARRRAVNAQVLVANHALFFSDLALRREGVSLLPDYDAVILDECHTIESVAGDHLGVRITNTQVDFVLDRLYNAEKNKGVLVDEGLTSLQSLVNRARFANTDLFSELLDALERGPANGRVASPGVVENPLSKVLEELSRALNAQAEKTKAVEVRKDLSSASERTLLLAGSIRQWIGHEIPESVYWMERTGSRRGGLDRVSLIAAPIDVGAVLGPLLFQSKQIKSVIMTSATLADRDDDKFDFFKSRVGVKRPLTVRVGSPFDYSRQAELVVEPEMPDPSADRAAFEARVPDRIRHHTEATGGRTLALFTSYDLLRRTATALSPWASRNDMTVYAQDGSVDRGQLLEQFRADPRGVLLGTDSFWQGIDLPGDVLKTVIITKLPFSVPNHPLLEARLDAIRKSGGNPFNDYQLPEAVIKFRQGFGRLIRTSSDTGRVVVLDPRLRTKRYGKRFLDALPEMRGK